MAQNPPHVSDMRLYSSSAERLYINANERKAFLAAARQAHPMVRSLALTLTYTGCRLSEALALRGTSIQPETRILTFRTLKRRNDNVFREVPVPVELIKALRRAHDLKTHQLLYAQHGQQVHRATAYRWVKRLMLNAGHHRGAGLSQGAAARLWRARGAHRCAA